MLVVPLDLDANDDCFVFGFSDALIDRGSVDGFFLEKEEAIESDRDLPIIGVGTGSTLATGAFLSYREIGQP